jgi:HrpA-like RNA helicase
MEVNNFSEYDFYAVEKKWQTRWSLDKTRIRLLLHLLSPAQRPIQVTEDLAGFWQRSYPEVKKELKGRYPKHHWPDDPLMARPTARIKKKTLKR